MRLVPGIGPDEAPIAFVGEAPGEQEEREGVPFIGASGTLLRQTMASCGIAPEHCYITNVIKERPPKNDISVFIDLDNRSGPKMTDRYREYEDILAKELERLQPNVVVAVGAVPLWALCGQKGITKWRGSILESTLVPGLKVIPIIHPAAALRQFIWRHFIAFDLRKAHAEMEFPEIRRKFRDYIIRPTYEEARQYLAECKKAKRVAYDIEVSGEEVSCISFAHSENSAISIPFYSHQGEYFSPEEEVDLWTDIAEVLNDPRIETVGQNVSFDATFLYNRYGIYSKNLHDTMVAAGILFPDFPKGLDFITSVYTDIPYYKDDGKYRHKTGGGRDEDYWLYNAKDSIVLMEAFPKQLRELETQGNLQTYLAQVSLIHPFLYMTERGINVDQEGLRKASEEALITMDGVVAALEQLVGRPLNPGSPKQLMEYFYGEKGEKPYLNLKTKKPTTDEKAMKRLARKGYEEAKLILAYREQEKLRGTYYEMKMDADGRLRGAVNIVGTESGRVSSSKNIFGTGGNLQNLPPEMKRFLRPDPGYVAYEIDLSQAENRVVAYLGPDINMITAFEQGLDIHSLTAALIFGEDPDDIKRWDKQHDGPKCPIGGGSYTHRFWGKKANHGLNYDLSYKTFALYYEIPEKEAKYIVDRYHAAYPGVRTYHRWVKNQLQQNRTLTNLHGRKRLYMDRWSDSLFKEGYSFIPQSTVADQMNRLGISHIYYNQELYPEVVLTNQVHDSVLFQIPLSAPWERHAQIINSIRESLETPLEHRGRSFTIPADLKMLVHNFGHGAEHRGEVTPEWLEATYEREVRHATH